jgi:hypothetical protein
LWETGGKVEEKALADIPKVRADQFAAVIKALLNTPPMPMSDIPRKRELKAKKRTSKKKPS